jgi:hypothetical protein
MSDLGPSGNDPDAGLQPDLGADLHVWTTRWDQIEQDRADAPQEALEEAADLLDEMFAELHVPTRATEAPETEDVVRAREQIQDVVGRINRDVRVAAEEVDAAFEEARGTYQLLITGRRASGDVAGL